MAISEKSYKKPAPSVNISGELSMKTNVAFASAGTFTHTALLITEPAYNLPASLTSDIR